MSPNWTFIGLLALIAIPAILMDARSKKGDATQASNTTTKE